MQIDTFYQETRSRLKPSRLAAHQSHTKKLHEHTWHSSWKKYPKNYQNTLSLYIRKLLGCTKRCLEILSVICILHTFTKQGILSVRETFVVWRDFCLLHFLKKILRACLPFALLLLDGSLLLYPSFNTADGSLPFLLLFLMSSVTSPLTDLQIL